MKLGNHVLLGLVVVNVKIEPFVELLGRGKNVREEEIDDRPLSEQLIAFSDAVVLDSSDPFQDVVSGLAINPDTPIEAAEPFLEFCDLLLVMSVNPGFGGQKFIDSVLPKMSRAKDVAGERLLVSVDGGVAAGTIGLCAEAGADIFVAGSSIFDHDDYATAGAVLTEEARRCGLQA